MNNDERQFAEKLAKSMELGEQPFVRVMLGGRLAITTKMLVDNDYMNGQTITVDAANKLIIKYETDLLVMLDDLKKSYDNDLFPDRDTRPQCYAWAPGTYGRLVRMGAWYVWL